MAARRTEKKVLRNCNLILTSTLFENAGDMVTSRVENTLTSIFLPRYTRRHINFRGKFVISFPNTAEPDESAPVGHIFPCKEHYELHDGTFTVTALEPNSQYYCIIPAYISNKLEYKRHVVTADQVMILQKNRLYFIYNTQDYLLADQLVTTHKVVACENSSSEVKCSTADLVIYEFYISNLTL